MSSELPADDVARVLVEQPAGAPCVEEESPGPSASSLAASDGDLRAEAARQTGRFTFDVAHEKWEWDDDVYAIHGYQPHEVEPTTELFLRHKHEADRQRVEETFQHATETGEPFNVYYRIRARDIERRVVVVGEGVCDDEGQVTHLVGYYLDLTPEFTAESAAAADAAVAASAAARDTIEQAKGVLMLGYGLEADAAFAMLRWWSRNRNVKVREVADRLIAVAREGHVSHPGLRRLLDALIDDLTNGRLVQNGQGPADRSGANYD